jgi:membrane-bound lytic murein transglycosylase F
MKIIRILIPILIISFLSSCNWKKSEEISTPNIDLKQIKKRGKLIAVTDFNSIDYFIYRGAPFGFQLEMLKYLAKDLNVAFEIQTVSSYHEAFDRLATGRCDIIAMNVAKNEALMEKFVFTTPIFKSRPVLIARKENSNKDIFKGDTSNHMKIVVEDGSSFVDRLRNIKQEHGLNLEISISSDRTEDLIDAVNQSKIDFTVANEKEAGVNLLYYPDLKISAFLGFPQDYSWVMRKNSGELYVNVNLWLAKFMKTDTYKALYIRYFENPRIAKIVFTKYFANRSGKISPYDALLQKWSKEINWDWRLLAALIYQESQFKENAKSWAGASGLMQLMPSTADLFGIDSSSNVEQHIRAGVQLLAWFDRQLKKSVPDPNERIKFILASYNVGIGHILDAQKLAYKYGKNPSIWDDNVEYFLIGKSNRKYYNDPVVRNGYCKGILPSRYVKQILSYYEHYKNLN